MQSSAPARKKPDDEVHLQERAARIKYALACSDYTQADLALELDRSRSAVSMVINGRGRSKRIELRIAAITRRPLAELWPQWHGPNAKARRRRATSTTQITDARHAAAS